LSNRVLVIGGAGHFGRLLIDDLRRFGSCEIVAPGRNVADLSDRAAIDRVLDGVTVAICAAGPFQKLPLTLAEQCLQRRVHYVDLADDRRFVLKVRSLAADGRDDSPAICTGWSTVPALSGLLVHIMASGLECIDAIYTHMAPGNRLPRGRGTIASLLHSVGQPLSVYRGGCRQTVAGWSSPRMCSFPPPIGRRVGYIVDAPDHELFPELFGARTVEFRAGAELRVLNIAASALSWTVRQGLVRDWTRWTAAMQRLAAAPSWAGHDWGAIGVEVNGVAGGRVSLRRSFIIAESSGQRIAVMPASIMTQRLLAGVPYRGVVSPATWLTRDELRTECERRALRLVVEGN
jgi:hypothetical protein